MIKFILVLLTTLFCSISLYAYEDNTPLNTNNQATQSIVNINQADVKTLAKLQGVGVQRAKAIVAYREQYGNFTSINDLLKIKGIGKKIVESNRTNITF